jgi:hypothetical protein
MVNKAATITQVCEYFNGKKGNLPVIVNVQNSTDYRAVLDGLTEIGGFLRVSAYFGNSPLPDTSKMLRDIAIAGEKVVVLGLFQALCFCDEATVIKSSLGGIANCTKKILVLAYGINDPIKKKLKEYLPLKDKAQIFFVNGQEESQPKLALTSFDLKCQNYYNSLKDYFLFLEENGCGQGVVKSTLTEKAFEGGIWSVSKPSSAFELLKDSDENFAEFDASYGTKKQWEDLIKDIRGTTFKDLLSVLGVDLLSAIKKFNVYSETQKWRAFLWLKSERNKGYLSLVAQKANTVDEVIPAVYNAILDIDPKHKSFAEYYAQRKDLIIALDDTISIKEFAKLSNSREKDKVQYLTDATEVERKEIITCFTRYDYTPEEMKKIAQRAYPLLAEYLSPFIFNNDVLDGYFEDYKIQKIRNVLTDKFKCKVTKNALAPRPFLDLPTRTKVISQLNADNAVIYWVDALGAEFCAYINQRCKHYGISGKIQIARAELPTLTKFNQDFAPLIVDKSIKDLDELKHAGVDDHDYTKSKLPLYIESELRIIDRIIKNVQAELAGKKKVIILSDHGASRLVRIADNILMIAVDTKEGGKDEKHGGRCCAWNPEIPKQYNTVTDSDNNGFCVIANYDRFKGGKYTGVELHGGATLEEVIVPIIEITIKTTEYKYTLKTATLTLRGRKADPLVISLSNEVAVPKIKIQGQTGFIVPIKVDETTYTFETNITKSGKCECVFFDDNEEIIRGIAFEVKSAIGGINDLF